MEAVEKLTQTNAAYEKEQHRLQKDLTQSRKDIKEAQDDRRKLQEEVRHLKDALDVATSTRVCLIVNKLTSAIKERGGGGGGSGWRV